jgi:hypothetical protein
MRRASLPARLAISTVTHVGDRRIRCSVGERLDPAARLHAASLGSGYRRDAAASER